MRPHSEGMSRPGWGLRLKGHHDHQGTEARETVSQGHSQLSGELSHCL